MPAGSISVNGVGYNSTSTAFVSSASYRAWGALKSSAYGNSTSVTLGYNSRGLITSFAGGGSGAGYQYYADGQIKFAQDQSPNAEPIKDRAFSYDHAGRLQEAYSGSEARNFINNTSNAANGPFRQSYSYDGFSNMVSENWRFWSRSGETNATYNSSNRNTVWSYDADGNLLGRGDGAVYGYDAAGNEISQHQETSYYDPENSGTVGLFFLNTEGHDGDGQLVHYVKKMDHNFNGSTPSNSYTDDVYKLCSTILGGRVISEYNGSGAWKVSYVYLGGERIGTQLNNGGSAYSGWRYVDPITGDEGNAILDPQGVDVGHEDQFPPDGSGDPDLQPNGSEPFKGAARMIPIEGSAVRCVLDGITADCGFIRGEISVQCPDNDCGPQRGKDGKLTQPFRAFADDHGGYLPLGAEYDGNGKYHMPRPDGDRGEGQLERFNHAGPQNPQGPPRLKPQPNPPECVPFTAEIMGNPANRAALEAAWNRSQAETIDAHEEGGLLGLSMLVPHRSDRTIVEDYTVPGDSRRNELKGFNSWAKAQIQANESTVEYRYSFHTHPFKPGPDPIDPTMFHGDQHVPGPGDAGVAANLKILGILVTKDQIELYDSSGTVKCRWGR